MEENKNLTSPKITIEQYDGPFHLLVEMLEQEKLPITEVALSQVTEQYLAAINSQGRADPYTLADFLVVAARLLYLKSRNLLPFFAQAKDEDEVSLETQLKLYQQYYAASKQLEKIIQLKKFAYTRDRLAVDVEIIFNPPHSLDTSKLKQAMAMIIDLIEPIVRVPKKIIRKTIFIRDRIDAIRRIIIQKVTANFTELLSGSRDKAELIVTFLAMLELVKQRVIVVDQAELHGEITLARIKNPRTVSLRDRQEL